MSNHHNEQSNDPSSNTSNPRQGNQMNDSSGQSERANPQQGIMGDNWNKSGAADRVGGQWNQIKGQIKQRWGQLTDDDLMQAQGNFEQLVGLIQQRTGQSREAIAHELGELMDRQPESEGSAGMGSNSSMRNNKDMSDSRQVSDDGENRMNRDTERPAKLVAAN